MVVRKEWLAFYEDYLSSRASLKVLFQLIDGRHGPMADDCDLMELFARTSAGRSEKVQHVVVLTKMDKINGKIRQGVLDSVRSALGNAGLDAENTPVVLSSSQSKLGRDELWQHLALAATANWEDVDQERSVRPQGKRLGGHGRDAAGNAIKKGKKRPAFRGLDKALQK
jgi:GTP-binding protein EngB required for normal cell division